MPMPRDRSAERLEIESDDVKVAPSNPAAGFAYLGGQVGELSEGLIGKLR
jgi:hypothetical protein